jgi:hypothetical protein
MVTRTPANIFGLRKGKIEIGARADILLFESRSPDPLEDLLSLRPAGIKCLLRNGTAVYAEKRFQKLAGASQPVIVDGIEKIIIGNFARSVQVIRKCLPSYSWNRIGIDDLSLPDLHLE